MISYSSELMSADLPAPPDAAELRYTDQNEELSFETAADKDAVVAYYRKTLATTKWEPTLEHTVQIDDKDEMIFRNPAFEAKKAEEAAQVAEANKPLPKLAVTLPADAKGVEQAKDEIKFTVGNGKAKAVVETLRGQFREAGWKEDLATLNAMAGALSFSKEKQSLTISYTDTGMMPAEISLSAMGAELERH